MITLGLHNFLTVPPACVQGKRLGLLSNQASTDHRFRHSKDLIYEAFPGQLTTLFSPQHGFFAEKQDNMIESGHGIDPDTGLPLYSLYGEVRKPSPSMLENIDVLLIDLPDVGTRVYTFMWTLLYCLEAASAHDTIVVVLDRPNPLGGEAIEGNMLHDDWRSFVGLLPLPMRHGLTFAELALYFNSLLERPAQLEVVPMLGWHRAMLFPDTGLPWVYPSPNMPSFNTALVYPGQVIWEGTNISEGRGTTLPFELCGAPFIESRRIIEELRALPLPGCILRPVCFDPTANKWKGTVCQGVQIHVTDPKSFLPYRTSLAMLQVFCRYEGFQLKPPPYEYEYERAPLDLIIGDGPLRQALLSGDNLLDLENSWAAGLHAFDKQRRLSFLYT